LQPCRWALYRINQKLIQLANFLEQRPVTDWESAEDRSNREKINRARQAAEELFRPPRQIANPESASAPDDAPVGEQPRRQPRVFTIPPRLPPSAEFEAAAEAKPTRRKRTSRRDTGTIPSSQLGRVRALANYGMTRAEVAELYGVPIEEIDRIVDQPAYKAKSR
jgi:hypothetical protein